MRQIATLFLGTFTTLLAIINPLEALPIFLGLLQGQDEQAGFAQDTCNLVPQGYSSKKVRFLGQTRSVILGL